MRNLLQIVNAVINETGFGDEVGNVFPSLTKIGKQLLALAQREGYELAQIDGNNEGWPQLRKEYTFNTVAATESYAFPSDYNHIVGQTEWDRTQKWQVVGPATPQEWQVIKSGLSSIGPRRFFRIMRDGASTVNKIFLHPIPTTVNTIVFEYYSTQWCASAGGTGQSLFAADTDVPLLQDDLFILGIKWRFLRTKGLPYDEEYKSYQELKQTLFARSGASKVLPLNTNISNSNFLSGANIPDTGFGV